jgi:hypothetical protein
MDKDLEYFLKEEAFDKLKILNDKLGIEMDKSETLLLNILPKSIAERLKKGENIISDYFEEPIYQYAQSAR